MPRVKKKSAKPRKVVNLPRLIDVLPSDGFIWRSRRGAEFLNNAMCRKLVGTMRRYIDISSNHLIVAQMARMFDTACTAVKNGNVPEKPAEFWMTIASSIPWMKKMDGVALQQFAMKVLSARRNAMNAGAQYEAMGKDIKANKIKIKTKMTVAVDNYINLLPVNYSQWPDLEPTQGGNLRTILPDLYLEWWIEDDHNQGSEAETIAYLKFLEMTDSLTIEGKEEDDDDVIMEDE